MSRRFKDTGAYENTFYKVCPGLTLAHLQQMAEKTGSDTPRLVALPTEVWSRILYTYCGRCDVPPQQYNISRDDLRRKNSGWRRLIDADSIFWCRVAITSRSSVRGVQRHVIHIGQRKMSVSIDFSSYTSLPHNAFQCDPVRSRFRHANALLKALTPTSHLWRHVSMVANCMTYTKIFVDIITTLSVPSLTYFSMRCKTYSRTESMHPFFSILSRFSVALHPSYLIFG